MSYDPDRHHRQSIRRLGYDYAQAGVYFVTICTQERALFCEDEGVKAIAERCWLAIPEHFPMVDLDGWVVMPNHIHGLIVIGGREGDGRCGPGVQLNAPTEVNRPGLRPSVGRSFPQVSPHRDTLAVVVRTYKGAVTTACRREGFGWFAWQRNYYDRILRSDRELENIRRYIFENPERWILDEHHPDSPKRRPSGNGPPHP
jgi:putative transposase